MDQENLSSLTLTQLVDIYQSGETLKQGINKQQFLLRILTHSEIKPSLKNQAHILKRIFNYHNLSVLIGYLQEQNQDDAALLKNIKYDPSGENIPIPMKLPFMAMQILCCECQFINDILFCGEGQNATPLLTKLLNFLDHAPHYHLACYFSKVITAITKRVSSATHKYNRFFANYVFGQNEQKLEESSLFKSIKHFYSLSTFDYITRWLLMSTKQTQKVQIDGRQQQRTITTYKKPQKIKFLLKLVSIVNNNQLDSQVRNNIPAFFQQMFCKQEKTKQLPTLSLKSFSSISHTPKMTLYELAIEEQLISQIFEVPKQGCLNQSKIHLIKIYLNRYITEIQFIKSRKSDDDVQMQTKILQFINTTNLPYLYDWIVQHLKTILNITKKEISSQNSSTLENESIENSRVSLTSAQKMMILQLCELLRIIQSLQTCRSQIVEYYNEHCVVMANMVKRLMTIQNNLIHIETNKIVISVIKQIPKDKNVPIPLDFARKLLFNTLLQLIDISSIRMHVIEWGSILLSLESQHIFQDYEEEYEWEHIRQIIEQTRQIHVGQFVLVQSNIDCFYSQEKAYSKYSHFLLDFKPVMIYEDKKEAKNAVVQSKAEDNSIKPIIVTENVIVKPAQVEAEPEKTEVGEEDGESEEANLFFSTNNYLQYDINQLIQQL